MTHRVPPARALLAALILAAAPLAAQAPAGRIPVLRADDGTEVWIDSALVDHRGGGRYDVKLNVLFPTPSTLENGPAFDREVDFESLDCDAVKTRGFTSHLYLRDSLVLIAGQPGGWADVAAERRAVFDAACRALAGSFAASLAPQAELSSVDDQPMLTNAPAVQRAVAQEYPDALRAAGKEGTVTLRFRLRADGVPDPQAITPETATDLAFVPAAVNVVRAMRFRPARRAGRPVAVWVTVPVTFYPGIERRGNLSSSQRTTVRVSGRDLADPHAGAGIALS